jgi:hypothetical protein
VTEKFLRGKEVLERNGVRRTSYRAEPSLPP